MGTPKVITNFQSKDYTTEQLHTLVTQLAEFLGAGLPAGDETTRDVLGDLAAALGDLGRIVARERVSEFTARREAADDKRDRLTVGLAGKIRLSEYSADAAEVAAAGVLIPLLNRRPASFQKLSFEENTTELDLLLKDLASDAAKAALQTLGLQKWAADLAQAGAEFKAVVREATQSGAEEPELPRLLTVQLEINATLRLILGILAHFNDKDRAPYPALMEGCYDRIVAVRAVSRRRESAEAATASAPAPAGPAA